MGKGRRGLAPTPSPPPPAPPPNLGEWYAATTVTAALLVQMQFAAAVGARDVPAALQFADNWGHLYGVYGSPYQMDGACATADSTLRTLKGTIVSGVAQLDVGAVLTAAYMQQLSCGLSRLTWRPGEVDSAAQELLLSTVRSGRLLPLLASWRLVHATGVPAVSLTPSAQLCVFELVNTLMRQASLRLKPTDPYAVFIFMPSPTVNYQAMISFCLPSLPTTASAQVGSACTEPLQARNETKMEAVAALLVDLGVGMARTLLTGVGPLTFDGQYVSLSAQRAERPGAGGGSSAASASLRGSVTGEGPTGDVQELLSFGVRLADDAECLRKPGQLCLTAVPSDAVLDLVAFVHKKATADAAAIGDFLSPLPQAAYPPAAPGRPFFALAGLWCELEEETVPLASSSPARMAHGPALALDADVAFPDATLPEPYASDEHYSAGLRQWDAAGRRVWVGAPAVQVSSESPLEGRIGDLAPTALFGPYAEPPPGSQQPPAASPPPSKQPQQPPVIVGVAGRSGARVTEIDIGIIVGPIIAGLVMCCYAVAVFVRRRRKLQEMHVARDQLRAAA